jgi:hypothetical protein
MRVGRDGGQPRAAHTDLRLDRSELKVLMVLLRAVVTARERQDQWVVALDLAQPSDDAILIGELVIRERRTGADVGTHDCSFRSWSNLVLGGSVRSDELPPSSRLEPSKAFR